MIFDEIHLAKSVYTAARKSDQGKRIMRLQLKYPRARVVYCTATTGSEAEHLQVYCRLNMWGPGTPYADSDDFKLALRDR